MKPYNGKMVYWKDKSNTNWRFGYVTWTTNYNLIRLGRWNGDDMGGALRDINDIEWRDYN